MSSPNTYHAPVLLNEAINGLAILPEGIYVDATFGGGGHSKEILSRLNGNGKLLAFDQDADARQNIPTDNRLVFIPENFRFLKRFLRFHDVQKVDGILADLGVSSFQFDTGERGFSTRFEGPMDMRMDQRISKTAADVLMESNEQKLHKIFEHHGEVRNARQLAKHIVGGRTKSNTSQIEAFKDFISPVIKGLPNRYLAQVFQALRIEVNEELEVLKDFLQQAAQSLKPKGRICIITFHSLEDRIVKQFFKKGNWDAEENTDPFGRTMMQWHLKTITPKPIEPTAEEIKMNPRARSARLRIAQQN